MNYQQNLNMLPAFYKTCMHIPYIFYQKTFLPAVIFILIMVFLAYIYIMLKKKCELLHNNSAILIAVFALEDRQQACTLLTQPNDIILNQGHT